MSANPPDNPAAEPVAARLPAEPSTAVAQPGQAAVPEKTDTAKSGGLAKFRRGLALVVVLVSVVGFIWLRATDRWESCNDGEDERLHVSGVRPE